MMIRIFNLFQNILIFLGSFLGFEFDNTKISQPDTLYVDPTTLDLLKDKPEPLINEASDHDRLISFIFNTIFVLGTGALSYYLFKGVVLKFIIKPVATCVLTTTFEYCPNIKIFVANLLSFSVPVNLNLIKDINIDGNNSMRAEYLANGSLINSAVHWNDIHFRMLLRRGLLTYAVHEARAISDRNQEGINLSNEIDNINFSRELDNFISSR